MASFSVSITEQEVSMKNIDTKVTLDIEIKDIPSNIFGQLRNEVRTSRLHKPICSSRIIHLLNDSELYLWFLYETSPRPVREDHFSDRQYAST